MEFIKKRMEQKGISSNQLSIMVGCSTSTITRFLKGDIKSSSWDLVVAICKALDMKVQVVIGNKTLIIK